MSITKKKNVLLSRTRWLIGLSMCEIFDPYRARELKPTFTENFYITTPLLHIKTPYSGFDFYIVEDYQDFRFFLTGREVIEK